jgi:transposase InsO family protein
MQRGYRGTADRQTGMYWIRHLRRQLQRNEPFMRVSGRRDKLRKRRLFVWNRHVGTKLQ